MPRKNDLLIWSRLILGLLGFSALVTEIATLIERGTFVPVNFFSFFTVQSNILVVIVLVLSAVAVARGDHDRFDRFRAAVVVYILVVGLGFSLLLSGLDGMQFTAVGWDNAVLHYLMPIAMVVDYLIDRPGQKFGFARSLLWLVYPVIYLGYSLIRGALTGWYPYPFLDPRLRGYGAVIMTALGLLMLCILLVWIVTKLSGARSRSQDVITRNDDHEASHSRG